MERARVWKEKVSIPTYGIGAPEKAPMFLEKRVYQGSSGKVYPYPTIDKIYDEKEDKEYTAVFLEKALFKLGLTRKEANEFIVYWLPQMQDNPYNIISFQSDVYTEAAKLDVSPKPDTLIRVFMAWKPSDSYVTIEEQELDAPDRKGFTVVEWGGAKSVK